MNRRLWWLRAILNRCRGPWVEYWDGYRYTRPRIIWDQIAWAVGYFLMCWRLDLKRWLGWWHNERQYRANIRAADLRWPNRPGAAERRR
jgi:hypothetical protein